MTVTEIRTLFAYNSWANSRIFEALASLPRSLYAKDVKASHGSIRGILTHIVAAERVWLSRLTRKSEPSLMEERDAPTLAALEEAWEDVARRTARFLARMDGRKLRSRFSYRNLQGKSFTNTRQEALQHVVNHSTYHRGQITTLLRQAGATPVGTDLIAFYRHTGRT